MPVFDRIASVFGEDVVLNRAEARSLANLRTAADLGGAALRGGNADTLGRFDDILRSNVESEAFDKKPKASAAAKAILTAGRGGPVANFSGRESRAMEALVAAYARDRQLQVGGGPGTPEMLYRATALVEGAVSTAEAAAATSRVAGRAIDADTIGTPLDDELDAETAGQVDRNVAYMLQQVAAAQMANIQSDPATGAGPIVVCPGDPEQLFEVAVDAGFPDVSAGSSVDLMVGQMRAREVQHDGGVLKFKLPLGSSGGPIYARNLATVSAAEAHLAASLRNLYGLGDRGVDVVDLVPDMAGLLIVVAPQLEVSFGVDGRADGFEAPALTALRVSWRIREKGEYRDAQIPIIVTLEDDAGAEFYNGDAVIGGTTYVSADLGAKHLKLTAVAVGWDGPCEATADSATVPFTLYEELSLSLVDPTDENSVAGQADPVLIALRTSSPAGAFREFAVKVSGTGKLRDVPDKVAFPANEDRVVFAVYPEKRGRPTVAVEPHAPVAHAQRAKDLRFSVFDHWNAIALSGGAAKGSFQVGALLAFEPLWKRLKPKIVTGVSVGAINSLPLARYDRGDGTGIKEIADVWLTLNVPSDMWVLTPEAEKLAEKAGMSTQEFQDIFAGLAEFPDPVSLFLRWLADPSDWSLTSWAMNLASMLPFVGLFMGGPAAWLVELAELAGKIEHVVSLDPTQDKMYAALGPNIDQEIEASSVDLLLATVSAVDGKLYYVNEKRFLLDEHADRHFGQVLRTDVTPGDKAKGRAGDTTQKMIVSALASSAQFGIIRSRRLFAEQRGFNDEFMDGGHREMQAAYGAERLGAHTTFIIGCQPTDPSHWPAVEPDPRVPHLFELLTTARGAVNGGGQVRWKGPDGRIRTVLAGAKSEPADKPMVLDRLGRGLDVVLGELNKDERNPRERRRRKTERVIIEPEFLVHGSFEIDPGLVRINMAYGYMTAFDQLRAREDGLTQAELDELRESAVEIARLRKEAWLLESEPFLSAQLKKNGRFRLGTLQAIRARKHAVAQAMQQRLDIYSGDGMCFPPALPSPGGGAAKPAITWFSEFEAHRPERRMAFGVLTPFQVHKVQVEYSTEVEMPNAQGALVFVELPIGLEVRGPGAAAPGYPNLRAAIGARHAVW